MKDFSVVLNKVLPKGNRPASMNCYTNRANCYMIHTYPYVIDWLLFQIAPPKGLGICFRRMEGWHLRAIQILQCAGFAEQGTWRGIRVDTPGELNGQTEYIG